MTTSALSQRLHFARQNRDHRCYRPIHQRNLRGEIGMGGWYFIMAIAVGSAGAMVILTLAAVELELVSAALQDLEWWARKERQKRKEREEAEALERGDAVEVVAA
jgi:hypothetical protein